MTNLEAYMVALVTHAALLGVNLHQSVGANTRALKIFVSCMVYFNLFMIGWYVTDLMKALAGAQ